MALESALETLAQGFRIDVNTAGAGDRRFVATLIPPTEKRELIVTDLVTETQIVPAPIDLTWRSKDVRFANTDVADPAIIGGMPVDELLALNISTVTSGPTSPPGVEGVVGTIAGTIPLPIPVTTATDVPAAVDVRWRVEDESGRLVGDVSWSVSGSPSLSGRGGEIATPQARAMDALTLIFDLIFTEFVGIDDPTVVRRLKASVRVQANGVSSGWVDLPPVDLNLPAIPVPTVAILCRDTNFASNKLIVVPGNSPLDKDTVAAAVEKLRIVVDPLRTTFSFLGLFLDSAAQVASLLTSGSVTFRKADQISNLNDIDLQKGFWNDIEAEDELSSMILIGAPRRQISCFNARSFATKEGQMDLRTGIELIAKVKTLHSVSPASEPAGRVSVPHTPHGSRWDGVDPWSDITSFGDEFSSLRFGWES